MVDSVGSVGGYASTPAPFAGAGAPQSKIPAFPASKTPAVSQTGGDAVVPVQYVTPALVIDPATKIVVYVQRDPETGKVLNQYPSEKAVQQYQQADQQSASPLTDKTVDKPAAPIKAAPVAATVAVQTAPAAAPVSPAEKPA
jgi:hypothetical protein